MKARPFLTVVLAIVVSLLLAAGTGLWWVLAHSPLQLQHQSLAMPMAARFVPRQAPLSLYLFANGNQLDNYARAVAPGPRRHQAAQAVAQLRDGAFAAAGLDYGSELAPWVAPELGVALLGQDAAGAPNGWLLSLRSRDGEGARRFLQRFWQTRSLAGTDLQVSTYRGMGLISGRAARVGEPAAPLATALINDDLVLIASGRSVIEQALDVSQIDELNQASSPVLKSSLASLGEGTVLLQARGQALQTWLGLPAAGITDVVAALRPEAAGLAVEARLQLQQPLAALPAAAGSDATLLQAYRGDAEGLAVLQAPASWPQPLQQLLQAALAGLDSPIPALLASSDSGPLLWAQDDQGWLLGTLAKSADPKALEPALKQLGLVEASVDLKGQPVQVWTRLRASSARDQPSGQLEASLVGAHTSANPALPQAPIWWAQSLAGLGQQFEPRATSRPRLAELEALQAPRALLRWSLTADPARQLLQRWRPWQLVTAPAGATPTQAVERLALALVPEADGLALQAQLGFA